MKPTTEQEQEITLQKAHNSSVTKSKIIKFDETFDEKSKRCILKSVINLEKDTNKYMNELKKSIQDMEELNKETLNMQTSKQTNKSLTPKILKMKAD
jgi:hypothetical protein